MQDANGGAGSMHFHHLRPAPRKPAPAAVIQPSSKLILPEPTFSPPDPSKKSHARKQPVGHVPRPRNAFILFRCDFVRQKKIPQSVENDHRNISRIVGRIWREMTDAEKAPWVRMADDEKQNHFKIHPGYRFSRGTAIIRRKGRRGDDNSQERRKDVISAVLASEDAFDNALDRAASCPPGALHVPSVNVEFLNGYGSPLKTRDDLSRRPSRVKLYQSTPYDATTEAKVPEHTIDIDNHHYLMERNSKEGLSETIETKERSVSQGTRKRELLQEGGHEGRYCGPRLMALRYPIPGIDVPPEWENIQSEPQLWTSWQPSEISTSTSRPNDGEDYPATDFLAPISSFDIPFSSMLPPLPRSNSPHLPFEEESPPNILMPARKASSFFSPRTRTWKLPLPILTSGNDNPADLVRSHNSDLDKHAAKTPCPEVDWHKRLNYDYTDGSDYQFSGDVADEVVQEFSSSWISGSELAAFSSKEHVVRSCRTYDRQR